MEGRLHKSVSREIPTLYLLSDKEPLMGDELGAAGGSDRLWGNNKAISGCQRSPGDVDWGQGQKHASKTEISALMSLLAVWGQIRRLYCRKEGAVGLSWGEKPQNGLVLPGNMVPKSSECWDPRPLLVQFPASAKGHEGRVPPGS